MSDRHSSGLVPAAKGPCTARRLLLRGHEPARLLAHPYGLAPRPAAPGPHLAGPVAVELDGDGGGSDCWPATPAAAAAAPRLLHLGLAPSGSRPRACGSPRPAASVPRTSDLLPGGGGRPSHDPTASCLVAPHVRRPTRLARASTLVAPVALTRCLVSPAAASGAAQTRAQRWPPAALARCSASLMRRRTSGWRPAPCGSCAAGRWPSCRGVSDGRLPWRRLVNLTHGGGREGLRGRANFSPPVRNHP